jgi:hypothetical protein
MSVRFLGFESADASKALILLVTFALGVVTGILTTIPGRIRAQAAARAARKEVEAERAKALNSLNTSTASAAASTASPSAEADPYTARFGEPPNKV